MHEPASRPKTRPETPDLPNLAAQLNCPTPLARLLDHCRADKEFLRLRRLSSLLEEFHLKFTVTTAVDGRKCVINGRSVLNFGSANYLGLEQHPDVIASSKRALDEFGAHAGCSRIFSSHVNILALERELSELVGAEKTLVGHNLSQIHAGVLPALFSSEGSVIFIDRHAHASLFQAALIAKARGAEIVRVDTARMSEFAETLAKTRRKRGVVLVDGVYSMQGHTPPLKEIDRLCRDENLLLYIDDAHGIGALGPSGGGARELCGLSFDNLLLTGSLQKALGTYGGFISGAAPVIDFLRIASKAYVFSGTLQPSAVEGARSAIRLTRSSFGLAQRQRLAEMSRRVRAHLRALGFAVPKGESPIVPVLIGPDMRTLMAGRRLFDAGIYLNSVNYPAVPRDQGILRISLTSLHSDEQIDRLLEAFGDLRRYLELLSSPWTGWARMALEIGRAKTGLRQAKHAEI